MSAKTFSTILDPEANLSRYLAKVRSYPLLEFDEEQELARRWRDQQDEKAAEMLVTSHLRLVVKLAMGYRGYGLPLSDLISEGNVGMVQAIQRFDPERGFRLSTYAMWWIRAAIQEYILRSWSMVKLGTTSAQKKLFFNLRKVKSRLQALEEGDLKPETLNQIAEELDVSRKDVEIMNQRMAKPDQSLNAVVGIDGTDEWQDWLEDESANQEITYGEREELKQRRRLLNEGLKNLNEREYHIFTERRLSDSPLTLEALGSHYGISRERVRQIEVRAFEKVREAIRHKSDDRHLAHA